MHPISGKCRWTCLAIILLETLCSIKFSKNAGHMLDNPTPLYISIPWEILIASCGSFYVYLRYKKGATTIYGNFNDYI